MKHPLIIRPKRITLNEVNKSNEILKEFELLVIQKDFDEMEPSFKLGEVNNIERSYCI